MDGDQQTLTEEEKLLLNDLMPRVAQIVHVGRDVTFDQQMLTGEIGELLTLIGRLAQRRLALEDYQWISECADVFICVITGSSTALPSNLPNHFIPTSYLSWFS